MAQTGKVRMPAKRKGTTGDDEEAVKRVRVSDLDVVSDEEHSSLPDTAPGKSARNKDRSRLRRKHLNDAKRLGSLTITPATKDPSPVSEHNEAASPTLTPALHTYSLRERAHQSNIPPYRSATPWRCGGKGTQVPRPAYSPIRELDAVNTADESQPSEQRQDSTEGVSGDKQAVSISLTISERSRTIHRREEAARQYRERKLKWKVLSKWLRFVSSRRRHCHAELKKALAASETRVTGLQKDMVAARGTMLNTQGYLNQAYRDIPAVR